jgi:phosphoribosylformylglycinamidine synthase
LSQYRIEVRVTPRPGLLDPQGKAIHHSLNSLGWEGVSDVRVGKAIYVDMDATSESAALAAVDEMCRKLLANPVTEDYAITLVDGARSVTS